MNRFRRTLVILATLLSLVAGGALFSCWQYRIWSWRDWQNYQWMSKTCHPVWRDLHDGRIKAGDPIDLVIGRTQPGHVEEFENVTILWYGWGKDFLFAPSVSIFAKDGEVVSAGVAGCAGNQNFFDTWEPDEFKSFQRRYSAHREAKWRVQSIQDFAAEGGLLVAVGIP